MTSRLKELIREIDRQDAVAFLTEFKHNTIVFTSINAAYGWLGNMSPYPVEYKGVHYRTSEALFQCLRFPSHPKVQKGIREHKSPLWAKKVASKNKALLKRETKWDEAPDDIPRMGLCLRLKLEQHPELIRRLLNTRDAELIEDCTARPRDSALFWGKVFDEETATWSGDNVLGTLWMELRKNLRHELICQQIGKR